jgi:uncharacterized protein YecT (DUF1311 family)
MWGSAKLPDQMRRLAVTAVLVLALCPLLRAQDTKQLIAAIKDHYKDSATPSFFHAYKDLDGDGIDDAIVLMKNPGSCGSGGCNMLVFRGTKAGFTFVSSSTITNVPIRVSSEKSAGWNTLIVYAKGVGDVLMRFDGKRYPLNPSTQTKATASQLAAAEMALKSFPPMSLWEYTEEVQYQSLHEPHGIELQDGRLISYEALGSFTSWELQSWPANKRLVLAYSMDYGATVVDPETQDATSIRSITKDHPIDRMTDQCLEKNSSTGGMVGCYAKALSMWDKELNRFYGELMNKLDPNQKQTLQTAQREWVRYRDAQKAAIVAIYTEGTISRIEQAMAINDLTKQQAEKLGLFLDR